MSWMLGYVRRKGPYAQWNKPKIPVFNGIWVDVWRLEDGRIKEHMKRQLFLLGVLVLSLSGQPALAHHAGTAFDMTRQLTVAGTVSEFKWVNPHIWIYLMVPDENGDLVEWRLEGGSISILGRAGWTSDILEPGERIVVTVHPLRSGEPGGEFRDVAKEDGTRVGWGRM